MLFTSKSERKKLKNYWKKDSWFFIDENYPVHVRNDDKKFTKSLSQKRFPKNVLKENDALIRLEMENQKVENDHLTIQLWVNEEEKFPNLKIVKKFQENQRTQNKLLYKIAIKNTILYKVMYPLIWKLYMMIIKQISVLYKKTKTISPIKKKNKF
jgi:hypothetical protein